MENQNNKPVKLGQKLMEMQTQLKSFDANETSNKIDPKTKKTYKYTPGFVIIEAVRQLMDKYRVMLLPDIKIKELKDVEKDVFLGMPNGTYTKENKRDVLCVLDAKFTWYDPDSGETFGPFSNDSANMNDVDKSCASAHAFAKRYFLLDFFGITTRDPESDPDSTSNVINIQPAPTPQQPQSATPMTAPMVPQAQAAPPAYQTQMYPQAQPQVPAAPTYIPTPQQPQTAVPFNMNDQNILNAAIKLANYQKDTPTEKKVLNQVIGELSAIGYPVSNPSFIANLQEAAQARREGRMPNFR
jgi:hypothetical protein